MRDYFRLDRTQPSDMRINPDCSQKMTTVGLLPTANELSVLTPRDDSQTPFASSDRSEMRTRVWDVIQAPRPE